MACSTAGHEDKLEHGRSGLCQACYRRQRRRELDPQVGQRKPGPQPREDAVPHRRLSDEEKARRRAARDTQRNTKTHCVNDHELTVENTYTTPKGQKVCRICQRAAHQRSLGRPVDDATPIGTWNRNKTSCPWGHEYTEANTYFAVVKGAQQRHCKKCTREHRLMRTYGLERGQYDRMYDEQCGHCAGCERELEEGRNLAVDHCHATNVVRGLLCDDCNITLGKVRDDAVVLRRLASYVETHQLVRG